MAEYTVDDNQLDWLNGLADDMFENGMRDYSAKIYDLIDYIRKEQKIKE